MTSAYLKILSQTRAGQVWRAQVDGVGRDLLATIALAHLPIATALSSRGVNE